MFRKYQKIKKEQETEIQSLKIDLVKLLGDKITKDDEYIWMNVIQANIMEFMKHGVSYDDFISENVVSIPLEIETIKHTIRS